MKCKSGRARNQSSIDWRGLDCSSEASIMGHQPKTQNTIDSHWRSQTCKGRKCLSLQLLELCLQCQPTCHSEWSKHEQTFGKSAAMWHQVKKLQRNDEWWGPTPAHRTNTETTQRPHKQHRVPRSAKECLAMPRCGGPIPALSSRVLAEASKHSQVLARKMRKAFNTRSTLDMWSSEAKKWLAPAASLSLWGQWRSDLWLFCRQRSSSQLLTPHICIHLPQSSWKRADFF